MSRSKLNDSGGFSLHAGLVAEAEQAADHTAIHTTSHTTSQSASIGLGIPGTLSPVNDCHCDSLNVLAVSSLFFLSA